MWFQFQYFLTFPVLVLVFIRFMHWGFLFYFIFLFKAFCCFYFSVSRLIDPKNVNHLKRLLLSLFCHALLGAVKMIWFCMHLWTFFIGVITLQGGWLEGLCMK